MHRVRPLLPALFGLLLIGSGAAAQPDGVHNLEESLSLLAADLVKEMAQDDVKKLAVVEFSDLNGYQSTLGQFIAEELLTHFARSEAGIDVVERHQLTRVLAEQELTASALFDSNTISEIGQMLGIDALVTGSIAALGDQVKINARAVSVETARVFAAASSRLVATEPVRQLMNQSAAGPPGVSPTTPGRARRGLTQSVNTFFQNDFLRMEVASIGKSEDGRFVSLAVTVENLSSEPILLTLVGRSCNLGLVDNRGASGRLRDFVGLPCHHSDFLDERDRYAALGSGARTTLTTRFDFDEGTEAVVFSFSGDFSRIVGDRFERFSVGIPAIEL